MKNRSVPEDFTHTALIAANNTFSATPVDTKMLGHTEKIRKDTQGLFVSHLQPREVKGRGIVHEGIAMFERPGGRSVQVPVELSNLRLI